MGSPKMATRRQCAQLARLLKPAFEMSGLTAEQAVALAGNSHAIDAIRAGVTPVIQRVVADLVRCMGLDSRLSCGSLHIGPPVGWNSETPWNIVALVRLVKSVKQPLSHGVADYVQQCLVPKISVVQTTVVEDPVEITIGDLGFTKKVCNDIWFPELANTGFEPIPYKEAAFHAAIQYGHTLEVGDCVTVVTEKTVSALGYPLWFDFRRDERRVYVNYVWADPGGAWSPGDRLWVRRKSTPVV